MDIPKSQKATRTRGSAPAKIELRRALHIAQDDEGELGRGSISVSDSTRCSSPPAMTEGPWFGGPLDDSHVRMVGAFAQSESRQMLIAYVQGLYAGDEMFRKQEA